MISFQNLVLFSGRLLGFKFCNQRKGKKKKKKKKTHFWYVKAEFRLVVPTHLLVHYCDFVPN